MRKETEEKRKESETRFLQARQGGERCTATDILSKYLQAFKCATTDNE